MSVEQVNIGEAEKAGRDENALLRLRNRM